MAARSFSRSSEAALSFGARTIPATSAMKSTASAVIRPKPMIPPCKMAGQEDRRARQNTQAQAWKLILTDKGLVFSNLERPTRLVLRSYWSRSDSQADLCEQRERG